MFFLEAELAYSMVVIDKCDVYSFRVLGLEILMGKHTGKLISCLQSDRDSYYESNCVEDYNGLMDSCLSVPTSQSVVDELGLVLNVALSCISAKPESRPSMENVSKLLQSESSS